MPLLSPLDTPSNAAAGLQRNGKDRTLLIVDDEEGPRQSLRIVFKDEYNILLAENGTKALQILKEHAVDAAVLDIRMSGMSGIELLNQIKEIDPSVEVIMLTAYETIETARQALRLGACDYLTKPFDLSTMREAVANAMERHSLSEEIQANNAKLLELQEEIRNQKMQEEIVRARGEIYASVIHDINGPLTIISGFIDIINQRIGESHQVEGENLEIVKDRLTRITRQVNNCIEISRRYLSFLRDQSTNQGMVRVRQVMMDLDELLRSHPQAQENELIIQPIFEEVDVQMNGTDLIQVLLNLTINALQCSPFPHRVLVTGNLLQQPLDLEQLADGPHDYFLNRETFKNGKELVALTVRDNGPGIPSESLAKIFEPYYTTKSNGQGTGLGLAIVLRLLREAEAGLHLHSKFGEGTTFSIYLAVV